MTKRFSIASAVLTVLAAILASMLVVAVPAFAGPAEDKGKPDSKQSERGDHDGDANSDADSPTVDESDHDESTADEDDNQHPSGKDRSIENSPDSNPNQGKSESNPDDTNGPRRAEGVAGEDDKPNAGGGEDPADQDGNNGCGNDDDFDDDNNGWCGKPESNDNSQESKVRGKSKVREKSKVDDAVLADFEAKPLPDAPVVLGTRLARGLTRPAAPRPAIAPRVVRGGRVAGGVLPFTGSEPLGLLLIGLGILASGAVTMVATRK